MNILDQTAKLQKVDPRGILASAGLFPEQVNQAWHEAAALRLPEKFSRALNVVVAGMGGSALGARIIDSLAFENLRLPLEIVGDYRLPAYVNRHSLVVVSSYSGNTEEALSCFREAQDKGAMIFVISADGRLSEMAVKTKTPAYLFSPKLNPSKQPRMGLGYSLAGELALFAKLGFISLDDPQMSEAINHLKARAGLFTENVSLAKNPAKKLAWALRGHAIGLVSAEHLTGGAHAFQNMLNENGKTLAVNFKLPEMNHHLLEGLSYPIGLRRGWLFLLIESPSYDMVIRNRYQITKSVLGKQGFEVLNWEVEGRTRLSQALDLILTAGFASAYLAVIRKTDPAPIPWVDLFKAEMEKMRKVAKE